MKLKQNTPLIALDSILELLTATPAQILAAAHTQLTLLGYKIATGADYLFAVPPVNSGIRTSTSLVPAFVAHVDVVGTVPPKLHEIILSNNKNVLSFSKKVSTLPEKKTKTIFAPTSRGAQVLGADDRAGVYAMFSCL